MKKISLKEIASDPVSHDPGLRKKVLARDISLYLKSISHIILNLGDSVSEHSHSDFLEAFYCIRGYALFHIEGETVEVETGHLLFIELGEKHSIPKVIEETELLYFHMKEA
jgi:mannose-6-phosphate isomerase-like protein (cupin superfamily)